MLDSECESCFRSRSTAFHPPIWLEQTYLAKPRQGMLLTLLAIFSKVDAGGQIFSDEEWMTHAYTQESVDEGTYEANADAEDYANVMHMAASPPQIRVNIPQTKIRLEPELMNIFPETIIHEIAHEANLHAGTANVIRFPTPLSHRHDISSEVIRLSDVINYIGTHRQTIGVPDANYDYQFSKQFMNVELRDRPTIAHRDNVYAEEPRPNIYVLSQPFNVNYIRDSADAEVKLKDKSKVKISGHEHVSEDVKNRITTSHKSAHNKKHTRRPVKKPLKGKDPLNIRIDEHTNIELEPKSHIHLVSHSTDVDKPVVPVNVNVNVNIPPRRKPHMHPHRKPITSMFRERHTATHRRTTTRRTTRRRVTTKSTTRKPATAGTVKLRYDVWLKFGGCEYMVKRDAKDFDNAEASCRKHGSHLVSIHSEAENNFIHKITSTGSSVTSFTQFVYIGLRKNSKNEWKWIDGSPMDYKKWAAHQPDLSNEETCGQFHQEPARLYDVQDYHWNSIRCIRPMKYYVCKKCKHSRRHAPSHHTSRHKCDCCCSHCPCKDTCRNECKESQKHTPKPRPTQPSKPPGEQAVFPKGANTMCPGHNYMDDTMRMHMQDTHNFRRSELALGRIKDHKGKKRPTAANMNLLIWDCILEQKAYDHVRNCPRGPSGSPGENFYRRTITAAEPTYRDMNKKTVTEWWKVGRHQGGGQNSFTMMGWATSRRMGCVIARCGKDWVQSCRYDPPGNRGNQQYIPGAICSKCGGLQCNSKLGLCHNSPTSHK
ncbi:unnamed protein product [Cylicocyclus nassatus]|uniref:C-type lectin domain-containing protein n=1 Tax=Cylicocyclus nassatus TaxID=53992 RepID=A0AA36H0E1_CYLNA|nr:unnamed protein product [Cylicocyclus nassatus]